MRASSSVVVLVAVLGTVTLTSCGITGKKFAEEAIGYAVTRGKVVRVDNLNTERQDHLSDGVGIRVPSAGTKVSLQMGRPIQVIELVPGAILVLTEGDDFILQPYDQNAIGSNGTSGVAGVGASGSGGTDASRPPVNRNAPRQPASTQRPQPSQPDPYGPPPPAQPEYDYGPPQPAE